MKISLFSLLLLLSGCVTCVVVPTNENYSVYGYDFTKYSELNFLFTPESYNGKYKSCGLINVEYEPEVKKASSAYDKIEGYNTIKANDTELTSWHVKKPNIDSLIYKTYTVATKMGADAVINFNVEFFFKENGCITYSTVRISGFAIKRIE